MTRLLIVSDSGGNIEKLDDLIRKYKGNFDTFFHLGNRCFDTLSLKEKIPRSVLVRGNIELSTPHVKNIGDFENLIEIEGLKILSTYGHRYSVKSTLVFLKKQALSVGARLVFFGSTRQTHISEEDGIYFFNPGALLKNNYGYVEIEKGTIQNIEHGYLSEKW